MSRRRRIELICPVWQAEAVEYAEANGFERTGEYYKMGVVLPEVQPMQQRPALPPGIQRPRG